MTLKERSYDGTDDGTGTGIGRGIGIVTIT